MDAEENEEELKKSAANDCFVPQSEDPSQQGMFERIINKLLELNEKINSGKEISIVQYLTRLD